jgi:hypothetical protein
MQHRFIILQKKDRIFVYGFSVSFKTVTKLKLNTGNAIQALILPASHSRDDFHDLNCMSKLVLQTWRSWMDFLFNRLYSYAKYIKSI